MDRILVTAVTVSVVLATVLAFVPLGTADGVTADPPALNDQPGPDALSTGDGSATVSSTGDGSATVGAGYLTALEPQPTENTSARLGLDPERIDRADGETVTVDVGSSLQSDLGATDDRYEYHLVQAEYRAVAEQEQPAIVDAELDHLESRVEELRTREEAAFERYSEGELSTTEFVTELAAAHGEAQRIEMRLEGVDQLDDERAFSDRTVAIEVELRRFHGPVREQIGDALAGKEQPVTVYVEAADDGVVLSTIDDGQYVREAHAHWNIDEEPDRRMSYSEAASQFESLYPWAWSAGHVSTTGIGGDLLYRGYSDHQHGELTAYLDPGTQKIFVEHQFLNPEAMPIQETVVADGDGPNVTVERTYAGGPALVDAGTDDAEIWIDGEHVGTTGDDGTVWIVEPRPVYDLSITANGESTTATVEGQPEERLPGSESSEEELTGADSS